MPSVCREEAEICYSPVFVCGPGNGLGIRVVGGKEVPGSNGDIGAYVAKVLPGGAAEQTGKILEGKVFNHLRSNTALANTG